MMEITEEKIAELNRFAEKTRLEDPQGFGGWKTLDDKQDLARIAGYVFADWQDEREQLVSVLQCIEIIQAHAHTANLAECMVDIGKMVRAALDCVKKLERG